MIIFIKAYINRGKERYRKIENEKSENEGVERERKIVVEQWIYID